jgi:hypothetical protein
LFFKDRVYLCSSDWPTTLDSSASVGITGMLHHT